MSHRVQFNSQGIGSVSTRMLLMAWLPCLGACGGGSSSGSGPNDPTYQAGVYASATTYQDKCAAPRSGTADKMGSAMWEKFWLRSWTDELYLWSSEVQDINPAAIVSKFDYFDQLKTFAITGSGQFKDHFHFTYPTDQWLALSQSGVVAGYGVSWSVISGVPPRQVVVAYTQPGSAAATNNLTRGEKVISVDGVSIDDNTNTGIDALNAGLFPSQLNRAHTFTLQATNNSVRTVTMTSASVTETPVLNYQSPGVTTTGNTKVGYLIFNDHIATAESELVTAITTLQQQNISDLVLDLRYNGGGYLDLASELAYMIAGSAQTTGKTFERAVFNSKYPPNVNPVTGAANVPTPFFSTTQGFGQLAPGNALPALNLSRVFVITGNDTCSASESVINGLRGAGVQVIQIGSTTCGKPYAFYPQDNCGTTYFTIELQGQNELGFGDYGDGFSPQNTASSAGVLLPGCSVRDDFTHALGDVNEGRLAAALAYRQNASCGPATGNAVGPQIQAVSAGSNLAAVDGQISKGAWRENRIMR